MEMLKELNKSKRSEHLGIKNKRQAALARTNRLR